MTERTEGHCRLCNMRVVLLDGSWVHWSPGEYTHEAELSRVGGGDYPGGPLDPARHP